MIAVLGSKSATPQSSTRVAARRVDPGDDIKVKLASADPAERRVDFERVG